MKKVNLELNIEGLTLTEPRFKDKSPVAVFAEVIKDVVMAYTMQAKGMKEDERRTYYKISDLLAEAVRNNITSVDMDDEWVGFIRKVFRETPLIPGDLLRRAEEKIAEIKDR